MDVAILPITPVFGAEIAEVDLTAPLAADIAAALRAALITYGVLVFRDPGAMTRDDLTRLARVFGAIERTPRGEPSYPDVVRIVHDASAPPTENVWHVDHSFRPEPPLGAVLRAIELPVSGGDTLFADLRAVWARLPDTVRALVQDLSAVHDIAKWAPPDRADELHAAVPPTPHSAVRRHPDTGQEILFVNEGYTTGFVGVDAAESRALLDYLLRQVGVPEVQLRLRWQPGMVVVWDNRSLQHYAVGDYFPARRIMERVTIGGPHATRDAVAARADCQAA